MANKIYPATPCTGNAKDDTLININDENTIDKWHCLFLDCKDRYYEGIKVRKMKKVFRIIGSILLFLISSLVYGLVLLLIIRNRGLRQEEMLTDILISIPLGLAFIFGVFHGMKCCCCPKEKVNLINTFCV